MRRPDGPRRFARNRGPAAARVAFLGGLALLFVALTAGEAPRLRPQRPEAAMGDCTSCLETRLRGHVDALAGLGGRSWRQGDALRASSAYIDKSWRDEGLSVKHQTISEDRPEYVNLIAELGSAPGTDARPLVVAAHYDTAEGTPGADDNASGVAVLLELGRLLARAGPTAHPVTLAALTLEEPPFFGTASQGAWRLASELRRSGTRLRGAVVLESVGYFRPEADSQAYPFPVGLLGYPRTGDFLGVVGNRRSRALVAEAAAALRGAGTPVQTLAVPGRGWLLPASRLSDHSAFWDAGYPAVMVTDTAFLRNPNYHGPGDLPETLDYRAMASVARALVVLAKGTRP